MKKYLCAVMSLFCAILGYSQQADDVRGFWMNEDKDATIEIYKVGEKYAGKLTWLKELYERDGKTPRKDARNPDAALRNRSLLNLTILNGFIYEGGEWSGGELYDPKSGKKYNSKMKLKSGKLEIRGFVGSPVFGKTTTWTRSS